MDRGEAVTSVGSSTNSSATFPTGVGQSGLFKFEKPKLARLMAEGSSYVVENGWGTEPETSSSPRPAAGSKAPIPDRVSDRAYTRGL